MIPLETLSIFLIASVALALAPGPDNVFVLTQSALHGRGAALFVTFGLCSGLLVHTAAVSLGIAAIIQTSAVAFNALKVAGAAYLLYLAWRAFRTGATNIAEQRDIGTERRRLYLRGVVMNITNPKVAIFFLAFLPQFADPSRGTLTVQLLLLGGLFMPATLLVFVPVAWAAGFLGDRLKNSEPVPVMMNRVAGIVFVALEIRLAVSER